MRQSIKKLFLLFIVVLRRYELSILVASENSETYISCLEEITHLRQVHTMQTGGHLLVFESYLQLREL